MKPTLVPQSTPPPAEKRRQRIKAMPRAPEMLECRCGSRSVIAERTGMLYRNGKASGGTKTLICAVCLAKGERVIVL